VTVIHFWSPTCRPCQVIKPAVEDLKEEFSKATWTSVNTHADNEGLASKYKIAVVPTMVVLRDGVEVARHSGSTIGIYYSIIRKAFSL
jgi:thiol-disulfide isomerase/thioredoxin